MKSIILFFSALIIGKVSFSQINFLDSIKITYTNSNTTTIISISCEDFDSQFESHNQKKYKIIRDSAAIIFLKTLRKFEKINSRSVDVRGKIEFMLKGKISKYCFDGFGQFTNGIHFYKNLTLFKLLKKTIPDFWSHISPIHNKSKK